VNQPSRPGPVGERPRAGDRRSATSFAGGDASAGPPPGPAIRLGRYFGVDPRFWLNRRPRTIFRVPRARRTIPARTPEPTLGLSSAASTKSGALNQIL
jgi:hypothetical protein